MELTNRSPFAAEWLVFADENGQEIALLVIACGFAEVAASSFVPVEPQPPVRCVDEHFGEVGSSSVRYEADTALHKPYVDVIVNGTAYAPQGKSVRSLVVELHVADIHKKLRIVGDRRRTWMLFGRLGLRPKPFKSMPITYERAFGGTEMQGSKPKGRKMYRWNPVGVGFRKKSGERFGAQSDAPNILDSTRKLFADKKAAGFGVIGRSWLPRLKYAGTYDEEWLKDQWPLWPRDFDARYNQCAPTDQQSRIIEGGEDVRLINLTPGGEWKFRLPKLHVPVHLIYDDRCDLARPRLDTVIIEPDRAQIVMSARLTVRIERSRPPLREVVLGHVTGGWLRAKLKRKYYRDPLSGEGINGRLSHYE